MRIGHRFLVVTMPGTVFVDERAKIILILDYKT